MVVNDELGGVLGRVDEGIVGGAQVHRASLLAGGGGALQQSLNINKQEVSKRKGEGS